MLDDKQILLEAKKRFQTALTHWGDFQNDTTELMRFISGDQWTYQARQAYESSGFAALTSNRIPTFIRQITNDMMKNTPEIQIDPHDDADKDKAEAMNDLIRMIQENSNAKVAYIKGVENAVACGIGYWRVGTKFKDNKSFDKVITIDKVDDPNLVMLDPNHTGLCGEDSEFGFISTIMSKDEYRQRFTDTKLGRFIDDALTEEDMKDPSWMEGGRIWTEDDQVVIVEYFFKDYDKKTMYQIYDKSDGATYTTMDPPEEVLAGKSKNQVILQKRELDVPVVRWAKLNDVEVLEQTEWPGKYIPIVAIKADEYWVDGKRTLVGAVEPAVDAQVELNYVKSWAAQLLQMAPKAPYIGTAGQFKNFEQQWTNINVSNQAFIPYNLDGTAPAPARDTSEAPIQAAMALKEKAEADLQAIFGTFDPSQAAAANGAESGKAILARQDQSYNSNYHVFANLRRSIMHTGCLIVDAVPVVYDAPRSEQLIAQDGKKRTVQLNTPDEEGVLNYDLTTGEYTVSIQTGLSYGSKRQEMTEGVMALIGVYPESAPAIADLAVREMDWSGASQIADSLEALVPPQVLQARKTDPKDAAALVPSLQAQVAQLTQQNQALAQQHQHMVNELDKAANDIKVEQMKADVEMKKAELQFKIKEKELAHDEDKALMVFKIREAELNLSKAELALKSKEIMVETVEVMADINDKAHDRAVDHIDRLSSASVDVPGGIDEGDNVGLQGAE